MKNILTTALLFISITTFGQNINTGELWRTKGVYDSIGNFMERAKIQSFLYSSKPNQFYNLTTQDKMNMETGETKVFINKDTLNLKQLGEKTYKINEKKMLILHSKDSLTIKYNGYSLPYVRLTQKNNNVDFKKFKKEFLDKTYINSISEVEDYNLTYQKSGLVKINPIESDSEWESEFKIIDFNGYIILQGIVSAPKLITKSSKSKIEFIEIDYRFENKKGELNKKR